MTSQRVPETLPRPARLRAQKDFDRVLRHGVRASDQRITLYAAGNEVGTARLGIAAGRRLGNAVRRNRIKRLVREAFRRLRHRLPPGTDWIVVPKASGEPTDLDVQRSLHALAERLARRMPPAAKS